MDKDNGESNLIAVKHNIVNLVEYQNGSIVSRAVIKKQTGSVTIFAFDKGEELSPHSEPYNAFVHIIDGEAEITIDRTLHHLKSGEMIIMPANISHAVRANRRFKMVLTMIKE